MALQEASAAVRSACAMRTLVLLLAAVLASAGLVSGEIKTPQNEPIEITSTGETTYENGLATARDNVAIHIGNTDIYADYAQYNSTTHDLVLERTRANLSRYEPLHLRKRSVQHRNKKDPDNEWADRVRALFSDWRGCELNLGKRLFLYREVLSRRRIRRNPISIFTRKRCAFMKRIVSFSNT